MKTNYRLILGVLLAVSVLVLSACGLNVTVEDSEPTDEVTADPLVTPTPVPTPTPTPTPTPVPYEIQTARDTLAGMTLHEKICQLFIVDLDSMTSCTDEFAQSMRESPAGGYIFFAANLMGREQAQSFIEELNSINDISPFISVDEEGGLVSRCSGTLGTTKFDSMWNYSSGGTETAKANAKTIAEDIKSIGFNLDFAPVADVWSNTANTVIGKRAYSSDYAEAAELVAAAVEGFREGGVLCTLKHFPGHGDTTADTHSSSAIVTKTKTDIDAQELQAFRAGIEAGAELVMVGHIIIQDVDPENPASLSYAVITEWLRNEMGYDGLIVTDSLVMGAVTEATSIVDAPLRAFEAGSDILLMPGDYAASVSRIEEAVENGEITEERIDESVYRILLTKAYAGIIG